MIDASTYLYKKNSRYYCSMGKEGRKRLLKTYQERSNIKKLVMSEVREWITRFWKKNEK
jgi:hypothetical protein